MKKYIKYVLILVAFLVLANPILKAVADSGFDSSYDSGGCNGFLGFSNVNLTLFNVTMMKYVEASILLLESGPIFFIKTLNLSNNGLSISSS